MLWSANFTWKLIKMVQRGSSWFFSCDGFLWRFFERPLINVYLHRWPMKVHLDSTMVCTTFGSRALWKGLYAAMSTNQKHWGTAERNGGWTEGPVKVYSLFCNNKLFKTQIKDLFSCFALTLEATPNPKKKGIKLLTKWHIGICMSAPPKCIFFFCFCSCSTTIRSGNLPSSKWPYYFCFSLSSYSE